MPSLTILFASFCTQRLMEDLHLEGRRTEILLRTMGQERFLGTHCIMELEVSIPEGTDFTELPEIFTQDRIRVSHGNIATEKSKGGLI